MEEMCRLPLATSTQGRYGAGGGIAAGAAVVFHTKGAGGCMAAGVASDVAAERAKNAVFGPIKAGGCKAVIVGAARAASGVSAMGCEATVKNAAGTAGGAFEAAEWRVREKGF